MADQRSVGASRCFGTIGGWHESGRTSHSPSGLNEASGAVRGNRDREIDDVCTRQGARILRHAGRAWHRARDGEERLQINVTDHRDRKKYAISDEEVASIVRIELRTLSMFISKKRLSRRTFLQG